MKHSAFARPVQDDPDDRALQRIRSADVPPAKKTAAPSAPATVNGAADIMTQDLSAAQDAILERIATFSESYADQMERDYAEFKQAITDGRLEAEESETNATVNMAKAVSTPFRSRRPARSRSAK